MIEWSVIFFPYTMALGCLGRAIWEEELLGCYIPARSKDDDDDLFSLTVRLLGRILIFPFFYFVNRNDWRNVISLISPPALTKKEERKNRL